MAAIGIDLGIGSCSAGDWRRTTPMALTPAHGHGGLLPTGIVAVVLFVKRQPPSMKPLSSPEIADSEAISGTAREPGAAT